MTFTNVFHALLYMCPLSTNPLLINMLLLHQHLILHHHHHHHHYHHLIFNSFPQTHLQEYFNYTGYLDLRSLISKIHN